MRYDSYSGAVDHARLQRCLERCQAIDEDHPRDIERCAREAARDCACPCIASEDRICNALASSVSEAMFRSGYCR